MNSEELDAALAVCAEEPIHIPGLIQACGVLLGIHIQDHSVTYASENTQDILGWPVADLLGTRLGTWLPNAAMEMVLDSIPEVAVAPVRVPLGVEVINGAEFHLSVSTFGATLILELEPVDIQEKDIAAPMKLFPNLMRSMQDAKTTQSFMELLVTMFSDLSGYDRVMSYMFDAEWNGEVIAEKVKPNLEPFLGLRFPHWDIPKQARDIMSKFPVRFVADVQSEQVRLCAASENSPALDISLAELRGVSPIHLKYLENMDVQATMTISVVVEDRLWGIISFHHGSAKVPTIGLRQICTSLAPLINAKLQALQQTETLKLHDDIDMLRNSIENSSDAETLVLTEAKLVIDAVKEKFILDGVVVGVSNEQEFTGTPISNSVLQVIREKARSSEDGIWHSKCLAEDIPEVAAELGGICGALCLDRDDGKWICLLRHGLTEAVTWAGAPAKDIENMDGIMRLQPRGSFELYKQVARDMSRPWLKQDISLLQAIAQSLIATKQRKVVLASMRRQQELVLDELNHRVRNILALVGSISRQALRHNSSVENYASALEKRMESLAVAHDLGAGKLNMPVSLTKIIELEAEPFAEGGTAKVSISGNDIGLTGEAAPLVALVIHELMTNASKYGALSVEAGQVGVFLSLSSDGVMINWIEFDGPKVEVPTEHGFGTTLMKQAIPYELGGESEMVYNATGLTARFLIPLMHLVKVQGEREPKVQTDIPNEEAQTAEMQLPDGAVLVVEDNYMIAIDLAASLETLGFGDVELAANLVQARSAIEQKSVVLAVLDINLGRGGSSIELARELVERKIPLCFVTGYGDLAPLPDDLVDCMKLQKPLSMIELENAVKELLNGGGIS